MLGPITLPRASQTALLCGPACRRILAASTYICLASAIPALAFGVQAGADTEGLVSPVSGAFWFCFLRGAAGRRVHRAMLACAAL